MDFMGWVVFGAVGWVLGLWFVIILMRMAANEDRDARHQEKQMDPFSEVTVTRPG